MRMLTNLAPTVANKVRIYELMTSTFQYRYLSQTQTPTEILTDWPRMVDTDDGNLVYNHKFLQRMISNFKIKSLLFY